MALRDEQTVNMHIDDIARKTNRAICTRLIMFWRAGEVTTEGIFKVSSRHGCGARGAAPAEDREAVHWQPNILSKRGTSLAGDSAVSVCI